MSFTDYIKQGWAAAQLKADAIRQLSEDESAIGPAIGILAIGGVCTGIGLLNPALMLAWPFVRVIGGFIFVAILHFVATAFFQGQGKLTALAIPAFCASVIGWAAIVPLLGPVLAWLAGLWMLVVLVICVEVVYGLDRGKAIATVAIPFAAFLLLGLFLMLAGIGLVAATRGIVP